MKKTKSGFTIIEIIIIVLIISVGLLTVIKALQNSNTYLQKNRQKIIAVNLAREGMEQIINIRDTNRLRRAGKREQTRLKINPFIDEGSAGIANDPRIGSGHYITLNATVSGQQYFYATGITSTFNINNYYNTGNLWYSLCESGGFWKACPLSMPTSKEGAYFRRIEGYGLFKKDTTTNGGIALNCPNGSSATCGDSSAKEYRFCSIVEYIGNGVGKVELCSVITNFKK